MDEFLIPHIENDRIGNSFGYEIFLFPFLYDFRFFANRILGELQRTGFVECVCDNIPISQSITGNKLRLSERTKLLFISRTGFHLGFPHSEIPILQNITLDGIRSDMSFFGKRMDIRIHITDNLVQK